MSKTHTPTPWKVWRDPGNPSPRITGADRCLVLSIGIGPHFAKPTEANAEFIVRACNSHEALVQAVRFALSDEGGMSACMSRKCGTCARCQLRAALANADG